MAKQIKKYGEITLILGLILVLVAMYGLIPSARAGTVTVPSDTLSDSRPSTVANHTIVFTIESAIDLTDTVIIKFDDAGEAFNLTDVTEDDVDIEDDSVEKTTAADCSSTEEYSVVINTSIDEITFTACDGDGGNMAAGSVVTIEVGTNATASGTGSNQITNPAANVYDIDVAGTFGDTGKMKVAVLAAVTVSATIAETLTFSISDTAIGMGAMATGDVYFATADESGATSEQGSDLPTKLTVTTNASNGVTITMHDVGNGSGSAGLYKSAVTTKLIAAVAATAVSAGSEGYAVYGKDASGLTIAAGFDGGSSASTITTSPQTFASTAGAVSSADVDVQPKVGMAGDTLAGSYSDTLIFVATPSY